MPYFSLIVATRGRTVELERLIHSLDQQEDDDYELIIVDQNDDDRLVPIVRKSVRSKSILRLMCSVGVSRARNLGIEHAQGQIMAFPDDDCWYPAGTLRNVREWFQRHPEYHVLSLASRDENGTPSGNRWRSQSADLSTLNIFRTSVCYCMFVRFAGEARHVRFDEGIGPGAGTPIPASEDTEYALTALRQGLRGHFVREWYIGHPRKDVRNASIDSERSYRYGLGMGYVLWKHELLTLYLAFVAYDMSRAAMVSLLGKRQLGGLWHAHGRGLLDGYRQRFGRVAQHPQ